MILLASLPDTLVEMTAHGLSQACLLEYVHTVFPVLQCQGAGYLTWWLTSPEQGSQESKEEAA